jgi:aspartate/glutamate racemase
MKTVGVIGTLEPETTAEFYIKIIFQCQKIMADFIIENNKFEKILFPNRRFSASPYKSLALKHYAYLDDLGIKKEKVP